MIKNIKLFVLFFCLFFSMQLISAIPFYYYNVSLYYSSERFSINDINVIYAPISLENNFGDYSIDILEGNKLISKGLFQVPNVIITDNYDVNYENPDNVANIDKLSFDVFVPYNILNENISKIIISKNGIKLNEFKFANFINKKKVVGEDLSDRDIKSLDNKIVKESSNNNLFSFLLISIIVLFVLIMLFYFLRKHLIKKLHHNQLHHDDLRFHHKSL